MSQTAEHFASIDKTLEAARLAWDADRAALEQRILALETELRLTQAAMGDATKARDNALKTTVKLLTQFGVVSQVFEDAKNTAIAAGLYTEETNGGTNHLASNKDKIDSFAGASHGGEMPVSTEGASS